VACCLEDPVRIEGEPHETVRPLFIVIVVDNDQTRKYDRLKKMESGVPMVYLLAFAALVIVARIAGPIRAHKDHDRELRQAEYEHRTAVYGDPDKR
jgi:hypothetical protein